MSVITSFLKTFLGGITLIGVVLLVVFFLFSCKDDWCYIFEWQKIRMVNSFEDCVNLGFIVSTSTPRECLAGNKPFTDSLRPVDGDTIHVTNPVFNSYIKSPLRIEGEARGSWYFEASFPVRLIDANGFEISTSHAQAEGNWMTADFVPFTSQLIFGTSTTETGTLILEKDNPSGLLEKGNSISIPIRFVAKSNASRVGRLEGQMSIGPICPVEQINNPCKPTPEMFAARKIFVYLPDHKTLITTLTPNSQGKFGATLSEGDYWLDMTHQNIGGITGVPILIHINENMPAIVTISVDTGIR